MGGRGGWGWNKDVLGGKKIEKLAIGGGGGGGGGGGALFGIQEYILKNVSYVLCFQIVTTNLYILIRFMLYFVLLNFLCNQLANIKSL